MRKEIELYFFAVLLLGIVFLLAFFQTGLTGTGFAVFQQQDNTSFDLGTYNNLEYNGSAVVLSANQTSGIYTSEIFDAGNDSTWEGLVWAGQGNISFQIRNCSVANCANESFVTASDLNNLNSTSQYFQYEVSLVDDVNTTSLLESVSVDYSVIIPTPEFSIAVSSPLSQTYEELGVALDVTSVGAAESWWYSLNSGNDTVFIPNTTITGVEGANDLIVYANESGGNITSQNISFSVVFPVCDGSHLGLCTDEASCTGIGKYWYDDYCNAGEEQEDNNNDDITEITTETESENIVFPISKLDLDNPQSLTLNPEDSGVVSLVSRNTGTKDLSSCTLTLSGDSSGWVSYSQDAFDLSQGAEKASSLTVSVPAGVETGEYVIGASAGCFGLSSFQEPSTQITVNVIQKTFEFNLTNVRKIRNDEVRATYVLTDLLGEDQVVELEFSLFDNESVKVSNLSESINLTANSTEEFRSILEINESLELEGNLTISVDIDSQAYSSSVNEAIVLSSPPLLGFAIFDQMGGTGGLIVLVVSILAIFTIIFISRTLRRSKKIITK